MPELIRRRHLRTERRNLAQQRSFLYRFFRNDQNQLDLWQAPNSVLLVAMASVVLQLFTTGKLSEAFGLIFFGSIFAWGWLEVMSGTSLFRRTIGGLIMIAAVYFKIVIF